MHKISEFTSHIISTPGSALFYTPPIYKDAMTYFFTGTEETISAQNFKDIDSSLTKIDELLDTGKVGFGYINYEAGYHFEMLKNPYVKQDEVLKYYFCDPGNLEIIQSTKIAIDTDNSTRPDDSSLITNLQLNTTRNEYINSVHKIKEQIKYGNTYQINYTVQAHFTIKKTVSEIFTALLYQQSAEYICLFNDNGRIIISFSPELFFEVSCNDNKIKSKPMKGTIKRGVNLDSDKQQYELLRRSEKDQAENIMIVDLLRNDLGKISKYNTVFTENQYEIKKYESLYQMVTTVNGELKTISFKKIIENIFPCGSITGAPKRKTMEIISWLEKEPRGIYTGTIGFFTKDNWIFNVPIRTIELNGNKGKIGIGSGIVWDSQPENEYEEVLLKSKFLTHPSPVFNLTETMLMESGKIFLKEYHINRIEKTAEFFLFNFNKSEFIKQLDLLEGSHKIGTWKIRVELNKWGRLNWQISPYESGPEIINVSISNEIIDNCDKFVYFKTTNRNLYNSELDLTRANGYYEVIFRNANKMFTEGAISNILIYRDGKFTTPPIEAGILNGCYRQYLIDKNLVEISNIDQNTLLEADSVILINSVFKLKFVDSIYSRKKLLKKFELSETDRVKKELNIEKFIQQV